MLLDTQALQELQEFTVTKQKQIEQLKATVSILQQKIAQAEANPPSMSFLF